MTDQRERQMSSARAPWEEARADANPVPASPGMASAYEEYAKRHPTKAARQLVRAEAAPDFDRFVASPRGGAMIDGLRAGLDGAVRCRRCGRALDDPLSVARNLGADCWAKLKQAAK